MPAQEFDFEICVPVATPVKPAGRVQPGEWPAMRVARTTYHGPYDGLAEAWGEFDRWIAASALKPAAELYEVYSAGPESSTDPANWTTQLNRPLTD
jgi:effector-binding domain-containing protein